MRVRRFVALATSRYARRVRSNVFRGSRSVAAASREIARAGRVAASRNESRCLPSTTGQRPAARPRSATKCFASSVALSSRPNDAPQPSRSPSRGTVPEMRTSRSRSTVLVSIGMPRCSGSHDSIKVRLRTIVRASGGSSATASGSVSSQSASLRPNAHATRSVRPPIVPVSSRNFTSRWIGKMPARLSKPMSRSICMRSSNARRIGPLP